MFIKDALNYFCGYLFQEKRLVAGEKLIEELSQYSQFRTLIEEAQKVVKEENLGDLRVYFEQTKSGFHAEQENNVIRIQPDLSVAQKRDRLVFELTNVIQHKKHNDITMSAVKGVYKNAEEYARAKEDVEFNGVKRRSIVSRAINREKGYAYLENPWEDFPIEDMEFDTYYNSHLDDNHKEFYRKSWKDIQKWKRNQNLLNIALGVTYLACAVLIMLPFIKEANAFRS